MPPAANKVLSGRKSVFIVENREPLRKHDRRQIREDALTPAAVLVPVPVLVTCASAAYTS